MEKSNSQKIQLGIFVIIGTIVFLAAIYFVGNKQNMFGNTSNLKAVFANVNGLQPGNNVRYAGIDIGTVTEIEMINDTTININMLIDNKIMHHIQKNAVATISSDGLVGNMIVNIIPGKGVAKKVENGGVIQTSPNGTKTLNQFNKDNSPLPSNNILKIAIDKSSGKVFFATDKGIVAFNSKVAEYGDVLPEVYAYPNPSTKNNDFITIDGRNGAHLPNKTNVKILDTAGNLVFETNVKEGQEEFGGKVVWNKTNLAGNKVASGVYIVLLSFNEAIETAITKIAIIN